MKKIFLVIAIVSSILLCSCSDNQQISLDISEMRKICDMAVLECYYHNNVEVSKKQFKVLNKLEWVDYGCTVKLGIDISRVKIDVDGMNVNIKLPDAEIIGEPSVDIPSIKILTDGGWAKITKEDERDALDKAQENAKKTVLENKQLLRNAEDRVQKILENYIKQIGDFSGTQYVVKFEKLD